VRFLIAPSQFAAVLVEKINDAIAEESNRIAIGCASDWADYRQSVGLIDGFMRSLRIIQDMIEEKP
jgi:hypothetical protein